MTTPIVLSKIFERERPFMYLYLWDRCDREGMAKFLQQKVGHNLFMLAPGGRVGTVWYAAEELRDLEQKALEVINSDRNLQVAMIDHIKIWWVKLQPYLSGEKEIRNVDDFLDFYETMVSYWLVLTTPVFRAVDLPEFDQRFLAEIVAVREGTQEYSETMANDLARHFARIFPQYAKYSFVVTPEDVRSIANGEDLKEILEKRMNEGCFLSEQTLHPMSRLVEFLQNHGLALETVDISQKQLAGKTGYPGKAQGRVRVIQSKEDLDKVLLGEILVAALTDPHCMPAMQRAVAFVTDEGGILSHAAIVAREMKKPCVIGTKIGTRLLKTGDMVEVDADSGVVRKI